ncbi:MAG: hypothetical protein LBB86_00625 [Oscillospiraceae bacterium]|nr:hypothetical protein [Oscillospiraceae bacterium]
MIVKRRPDRLSDGLKRLLEDLGFRTVLLIVVCMLYFSGSGMFAMPVHFFAAFTPAHVLWVFWMALFIKRAIPAGQRFMAGRKAFAQYNDIVACGARGLKANTRRLNNDALNAALCGLALNVPFYLLYWFRVIDASALLVYAVFFFFVETVSETLFCPLQRFVMNNRCCQVCRVYMWRSIFTVAPLLAAPNFYSITLIMAASVSLVAWELSFRKHPEFFFEGSNRNLRCSACADKLCQIRGKMIVNRG